MQRLKELHDAVKEHPYRLGGDPEFLNSYRDLLCELKHTFWEEAKNTEYLNAGHGGLPSFYHDFGWAIGSIPKADAVIHLENCIGYIHRFIDTGRFDEYTTYYNGRTTKFVYLSYLRKHVPVLSRQQVDFTIERIEIEMKKRELPEYGLISKTNYDYHQAYKRDILPLLEAEGIA